MAEDKDRRTKAVTIYDVAKEAGVAASTVSRALSRPGRVSPETAQRVREAAAKLGYRDRTVTAPTPDHAAKVILVSVAGLANLYFHDTLEGIHEEATEAGYTVAIVDGKTRSEPERQAVDAMLPFCSGVIMISPRMPDAAIIQVAKQRPTVVVNRALRDVPSVVQNVPDGTRQIIEHLAGLGHKSVAFIAGPADAWIQAPRWEGVQSACAESGMHAVKIGPLEGNVRGGIQAVDAWRRNRTTAVVAYNDDMALGFMRAVLERGFSVPGDVSVVGVDNSTIASLYMPSLTSLALAGHGQGKVAARALIGMIRGTTPKAPLSVVPMKLVQRSSTGPAPEAE